MKKRDSDLNDVMSDSFHFPLRVCVRACVWHFSPPLPIVWKLSLSLTLSAPNNIFLFQLLHHPRHPVSRRCSGVFTPPLPPSPPPPNPSGHRPPSCCQQDLAPDGTGICPGNQIQGVSGALSLRLPLFRFLSHRSTTEMQPYRQY